MSVVTCVLFVSVITFSVQMEQWQVAYPNDSKVDLNAWTDGDISSCESISIKESVLLRYIHMPPVRGYLHVILENESNVLSGPDVPQGLCTESPSLMMTQTFITIDRTAIPPFPFVRFHKQANMLVTKKREVTFFITSFANA